VKTAPGELDYQVVLKYGGRTAPLGQLAAVQFPLVRVQRIPVELSQVRLHLPETHAWFHFGGTMGHVDEAEQAAGQVSYQTKVVDRLMKDLASSNPFTQARAASNLKQIGMAALNYDSVLSHGPPGAAGPGNDKLQQELQRKESVLKEAEQAADKIQQAPQQEAQVQDNRYQLNQRFNEQRAQVTGNEVKSAGRNFETSLGENQPADSSKIAKYNPEWLEQNDLGKKIAEHNKSQKIGKDMPADLGRVKGKAAWGKYKVPQSNEPLAEPQSQLLQPNVYSSDRKGGDQQAADQQAAGQSQPAFQPPQRGDTQQAKASRYQQGQLQKQAQSLPAPYHMSDDVQYFPPGSAGSGRSLSLKYTGEGEAAQQEGGDGSGTVLGKSRSDVGGRIGPPIGGYGPQRQGATHGPAGPGTFQADLQIPTVDAGQPATALGSLPFLAAGQPAGGLASLDVAIPMRGTVYFFSTPRGDAEINARAASGRLLDGLLQAVAIALAALVVWYVFTLVRRGRLAWLASRKAATVLLVLGLLGFCLFPGLAILAIAAGSGILVHNLLRRSPSLPERGQG
jgi:hypothetical protein